VLSGLATNSLNRPVVGLDFEISTPIKDPSNIDSVLVEFEKFKLTTQHIDESQNMNITISLEVNDKDPVRESKQISIDSGVTREISNRFNPIYIDGLNPSRNYISGTLSINIEHSSISKEYVRDITISGSKISDVIVNNLNYWWPIQEGSGSSTEEILSENSWRLDVNNSIWNYNDNIIGDNYLYHNGSVTESTTQTRQVFSSSSGKVSFCIWVNPYTRKTFGGIVSIEDGSNSVGICTRYNGITGYISGGIHGSANMSVSTDNWYFVGVSLQATGTNEYADVYLWDTNSYIGSNSSSRSGHRELPTGSSSVRTASRSTTKNELDIAAFGFKEDVLLSKSDFESIWNETKN
jgi:hypothetical protein